MCPREIPTPPLGGAESLDKAQIHDLLEEARERTLALVAPVSDENLNRVHSPLMSPLVWDLGHIAAFEELWLCQRAGGLAPMRPELGDVYEAAETPRAERGDLPYLLRDEALEFMAAVRERSLEVLERVDLSDGADPLNAGGLVWDMAVQHEHQHDETMLQTLQLAERGVYAPVREELPPAVEPPRGTVLVEAGACPVGDAGAGFTYDNERPLHEVHLDAFEIDRTAVTCGDYLEFVEDGGYERPELWSEEGWAHREREGWERPLYWSEAGEVRSFERIEPLDPTLPVMQVSWYEADAYARWRGARLPSEAQWEKAASWDGIAGEKRRLPWGEESPLDGRANLDQLRFGPAPAGALPEGASPWRALGMLGDCWEWTASDFRPYPGFRAFPYREYSEVFFGSGYKVLRGASWATRPRVARTTFRNWDHPQRRQLFAGFRCAKDA